MKRTFKIFNTFLWRDLYINLNQLKKYIINYALIYPILFSFTYGYILPNTAFNAGVLPSKLILLSGSISILFLILTFNVNAFLITDLEGDRFTNYQITILNPRLFIFEKIIFSSLFTFFMVIPFFIVCKLILQNNFDSLHLSITKLVTILFFGSITVSSYVFLSVCAMKGTYQIGNWWRRFNLPFLTLGGSLVPWIAMFKFSNILGYLILATPFIYLTEGIRGAIIGGNLYIPFLNCIIGLTIFSIIFICLSFYFFKKRVDYV